MCFDGKIITKYFYIFQIIFSAYKIESQVIHRSFLYSSNLSLEYYAFVP